MDKNNNNSKPTRRDFIYTLTASLGVLGAGASVWPIVSQMNPDSSVKAMSTVEVDISKVDKGKEITVMWRGKPVFIKRRTEDEITKARNISLGELPHPENRQRKGIKRRMVSCSWYLYTFRMCSNKWQR